MDKVYCQEVIITDQLRRGDGVKTPMRQITQVFNKDGALIAENDPMAEQTTLEKIYEFALINNIPEDKIASFFLPTGRRRVC